MSLKGAFKCTNVYANTFVKVKVCIHVNCLFLGYNYKFIKIGIIDRFIKICIYCICISVCSSQFYAIKMDA